MSRLELILQRDNDGKLKLWACRGGGKGCKRNKYRQSRTACPDCFGPLPDNMTLGEVQNKLAKGDA